MKKLAAVIFAIILILSAPAAALARTGIWGVGFISNTNPGYGIDDYEVLFAYNNQIDRQLYFNEIYPGSAIYIQLIAVDDTNVTIRPATDKQVKDDRVTVSYKASWGGDLIDSVSIVDIKRERLRNLPSDAEGMYIKVKVAESYFSTRETIVQLKIVLSVNRIAYQETEFDLAFDLMNRMIRINRDSIYGAQVPTMFEARGYSGEATFDMGGGVTYTARVRDGQRYIIDYTTEPVSGVSAGNPGGYLEFHRFRGGPAFASTGKLDIPVNTDNFIEDGSPQIYVYEINDGRLTALGGDDVSFRGGLLSVYTSVLVEYVLSSRSLLRETPGPNENIIQTGYASDGQPEEQPPPPATTPTVTATNASNINAVNQDAGNPLTGIGTGRFLPLLFVICILAGGAGLFVWRMKPFARRQA
jgi:hypothetical protein